MLLTPLNYSVSLQLVPVFVWESVDPPEVAASAAPAPPCVDSAAPAPPPDPPSDLSLVFKGYEWRPVAERAVFSREDWESVYRNEADAKEDERDPRRTEAPRHPVVHPPKPSHDVATGMHSNDPSVCKPDTSES